MHCSTCLTKSESSTSHEAACRLRFRCRHDDDLNVTSVTNALGEVTSFTWGRRQTLRTTTLPEEPGEPVSTWTSTWNADGKLVAQADPLGHETTFEGFDNLGNPTTVRDVEKHRVRNITYTSLDEYVSFRVPSKTLVPPKR